MKNFKKLMALVIAAVMVMGAMNLSVFAEGEAEYDSKLTIEGLEPGDTVYFYQVLGWENADATQNKEGGWVYQGNFIPFSTTYPVDQTNGIQITAAMAGEFARAAKDTDLKKTATADANGKVQVDAPAAGMYIALIQSANVDIVYNPVIVSADYMLDNASASWEIAMSAASYSGNAAAKKSKLEIKKSASTVEGLSDDELAETTAIGDTVSFTVDTTIPGYGTVYTAPQFIMKDTLKNMKLKANTVAVTGLQKGTDYTVEERDDGYTITFTTSYLTGLTTPTDITVTYDAIVTVDALKNINEEDNTVEIDYSHDPSNQSDLKAQKDTTQHYTFTIDANNLGDTSSQVGKSGSEIIKVGVKADGTAIYESKTWSLVSPAQHQDSPLAGAHFKLYRDAECTAANEYKPKNAEGVEQAPLDIVSDANGRLLISGLDAGDYWLKEVSAPAGFIKDPNPVHFKIEAEIEEEDITEYYQINNGVTTWTSEDKSGDEAWTEFTYSTPILKSYKVSVGNPLVEAAKHTFTNTGKSTGIKWESANAGTYEVPASIVNKRGVELPSTGGMGTTLFYAIGAVLVLGAGILLVSKRRMSAN